MTDDVTPEGSGEEAATGDVPRLPDPPAAAPSPLPPPPMSPFPPAPAGPPAAPKKRRPARVGFLVAAGVVVALGVVSRLAGSDDDGDATTRDDDGAITEPGDIDITRLRVGDCLDLDQSLVDSMSTVTDEKTEVARVRAVPCADEHNGEVIHRDDQYFADDDELPSTADTFRRATPDCFEVLEVYAGEPVDAGVLDVNTITPIEDGWPDDRGLVCIGVTWDDGFTRIIRTSGSLAAAADAAPRPRPTFQIFTESAVGDCYDLREYIELSSADAPIPPFGRIVPCSQPHTAEVVSNDPGHYEGDSGPPAPDSEEPGELCIAALEAYTGEPYETSPYDYVALVPNEGTWVLEDRALTCLGLTYDGDELAHPSGSIAAP